MDINTLGVASVAAITVICYLVGLGWFFAGRGAYPATDPSPPQL